MRKSAFGIVCGAAAAIAYLIVIRPWQLTWGATDDEVKRSMPGDDVVRHPTFDVTRGITVRARPQDIWPWLAQMGHKRAGWYSYDWVDNFFVPSEERIVLELQHLEVGDMLSVSLGGKLGLWVREFEPNKWLLLADRRDELSWLLALCPIDDAHTRLVTRYRMRYVWSKPRIIYSLLSEFGDPALMRKTMLGIKRRAEATPFMIGANS